MSADPRNLIRDDSPHKLTDLENLYARLDLATCRRCSIRFALTAAKTRSGDYICQPCKNASERARRAARPRELIGRFNATTIRRFWSRVERSEHGCWLWLGPVGSVHGYGVVSAGGGSGRRVKTAHRLSWELANGPIQPGLFVCHHCDVPRCVRPDHLFLGTAADNSRDMKEKGRHGSTLLTMPRGCKSVHSKLTERHVADIWRLLGAGYSRAAIARTLGVPPGPVYLVAQGKGYRLESARVLNHEATHV